MMKGENDEGGKKRSLQVFYKIFRLLLERVFCGSLRRRWEMVISNY